MLKLKVGMSYKYVVSTVGIICIKFSVEKNELIYKVQKIISGTSEIFIF